MKLKLLTLLLLLASPAYAATIGDDGSVSAGGGSGGTTTVGGALSGGTDTRVLYDDAGAIGEDAGLTYNETSNVLTATGGFTAGATADPSMILDVTTATDTDFWLGVQDDAGSDDDDTFQIGDGTTPGTNPWLSISTTGQMHTYGSNTWYLSINDNISTAISNATAGDTLVLSAGTYTVSANIDANKAINIVGRGIGNTIVTSGTAAVDIFSVTASNVRISNMSITHTGTATTSNYCMLANGGTGITGVHVSDVVCTMTSASGTGTVDGFRWLNASGSIRDSLISNTSSTAPVRGVTVDTNGTAASATTLDVYNVSSVVSTAGNQNNFAFAVVDGGQNPTLNIYNSSGLSTDATGSSRGLSASGGAGATANVYSSRLGGDDSDILLANAAVVNLFNVSLKNNTYSGGTPTYADGLYLNALSVNSNTTVSGTVVSGRTTDLGWSIVAGADTACNTTCTYACVFGQETTSKAVLACTDATADSCLCAGPN